MNQVTRELTGEVNAQSWEQWQLNGQQRCDQERIGIRRPANVEDDVNTPRCPLRSLKRSPARRSRTQLPYSSTVADSPPAPTTTSTNTHWKSPSSRTASPSSPQTTASPQKQRSPIWSPTYNAPSATCVMKPRASMSTRTGSFLSATRQADSSSPDEADCPSVRSER
jgi:hypothetical protein